jgi:glycosyltransferase involved in cell wall biosynthesis
MELNRESKRPFPRVNLEIDFPPEASDTEARQPLLSLIVPVYNEEIRLEEFLLALDAAPCPLEREFIFVDDCSKDRSFEILKHFPFRNRRIKIIRHPENRGKGSALHTGIEEATGDLILVQDADFEYDFGDVPLLLKPILEGRADVVYGSRFKKSGHQVHRTFHYLINRILTIFSNAFSGLYLTDMETCYKVFRAEILKNIVLTSKRFGFEPEITAKIARLRLRVSEVPISYYPRNYMEGKKITWKDGFAAMWHLIYFNFFHSSKNTFRKSMPEKYLINSRQWL